MDHQNQHILAPGDDRALPLQFPNALVFDKGPVALELRGLAGRIHVHFRAAAVRLNFVFPVHLHLPWLRLLLSRLDRLEGPILSGSGRHPGDGDAGHWRCGESGAVRE